MSDPGRLIDFSALGEIDRLVHEPARLMILALLYVLESADFLFLLNQTGLTWGNLSAHLNKLEQANYIQVEKTFQSRRPHTLLRLTPEGRQAFQNYRDKMQRVFERLPK